MTFGLPTDALLQIHVALSLIGIVTGLAAVLALAAGKRLAGLIEVFLASTALTSITGFPLPPFGFDPPRAIGVISLVLIATAVAALYGWRLAGPWRWIFLVGAVGALQLNVFVGIVQAFQKLPALQSLAPTQTEAPFVVAQLVALTLNVALAIVANARLRPAVAPPISGT